MEKTNFMKLEFNIISCARAEPNIKEKEHRLPLLHDKVCSFYKKVTIQAKVNTNSLFKYK